MSLVDLIKSLTLKFAWSKETGPGSTQSKNVAKENSKTVVSGRDTNIQGDLVHGDKHEHRNTITDRRPFIEITLGTRSSSHGEYTADFYLRNAGETPVTIQSFSLADQPIQIQRKTLTPTDPPYRIRQNITGYTIRTTRLDFPLAKVTYKDLGGRRYETTAKITQGSMAVGTFNIDDIEDNESQVLTEEQP